MWARVFKTVPSAAMKHPPKHLSLQVPEVCTGSVARREAIRGDKAASRSCKCLLSKPCPAGMLPGLTERARSRCPMVRGIKLSGIFRDLVSDSSLRQFPLGSLQTERPF